MKYYNYSMDMEREKDIVCRCQNDYGINLNALNVESFLKDGMMNWK